MQPDPTVAVNDVARLVGPAQLDAPAAQRLLQGVHARLRVVGQHGHVVRRRSGRGLGRGAQCGLGVGGVEPGGQDGAAAAAVELPRVGIRVGSVVGLGAARGFNVVEEFVGEVEGAAGGVGLLREGGDGGGRGRWGAVEGLGLDGGGVRVG